MRTRERAESAARVTESGLQHLEDFFLRGNGAGSAGTAPARQKNSLDGRAAASFPAMKSSRVAVACLAVACFLPGEISAATGAGKSAAGARPNIIFVLVDDMGWGDLNFNWRYADSFRIRSRENHFKTPSLDKMASEGIALFRHYSACPVSAPARASLMTGVHQGHARQVRDNTFDTPIADVHTLGSVLKTAGYATAVIGKWGIGGVGDGSAGATGFGRPRERGFDYFYGIFDHLGGHYHYPANSGRHVWENETDVTKTLAANGYAYSTDLFTARAKSWIVQQKKNAPAQPFFLYLALTAPHGSLRVPACAYPSGGGLKGGVQWTDAGTVNTATRGAPDTFIHPDNAKFATDAARRHSTMIRRVDDAMGDLFKTLKDLKIDDSTLVVFTSDNGPHNEPGNDFHANAFYKTDSPRQDPAFFKSYGMMDGIKRDCLEGGLRVPAIVRWPKHIAPNSRSTSPSQFQDWMATFAELAGVEIPSRSDGVSLLPTLTGAGTQRESKIYCEYSFAGQSPALADFAPEHRGTARKNQLVVWLDGLKGLARGLDANSKFSGDNAVVFEIYDTLKDPQETKNLAGTPGFGEEMQQKFRAKALRSRRAFDGKSPASYGTGFDFSQKIFFEKNAVPALAPNELAGVPAAASTADAPALALAFKMFASPKTFPWVPDFTQTRLRAVGSGKISRSAGENLLPEEFIAGRGARGILLEGTIRIPADGKYVFSLETDAAEASRAFAHLYDMQLVDADKNYTPGTRATSAMNVGTENAVPAHEAVVLAAGLHKIRIEYVCSADALAPALFLRWKNLANGASGGDGNE